MKTHKVACMAMLLAAAVLGQESRESRPVPKDAKAEIKERMKQRYADLNRLRDGEKVGETWAGLVEVVKDSYAKEKVDPAGKDSATIAELLTAENRDRKALFEVIAQEAKDRKLTPAEVGKQNGIRRLDKAREHHWLKLEDGRWVQKRDIQPVKK